jgi:diguanylate cyclase (GGDEF)-like protein/PAS domain S-box-containing protein
MKAPMTPLQLCIGAALAGLVAGALYAPMGPARWILGLSLACAVTALWVARRYVRHLGRTLSSLAGDGDAPPETLRLDETLSALAQRMAAADQRAASTDSIVNDMADAVFVVDAGGTIRRSNAAAARLLQTDIDTLRGRPLVSLLSPDDRDHFTLSSAATESRDYLLETARGHSVPVALTGTHLSHGDDLLFVMHDISQRRAAERRVNYLAKHDGLTRIPNRMQFQHLLQQALARAHRSHECVALFYIDVDRFKEVNDTFGHAAGDRALELLSERLPHCFPAEAVIGRLAGDEFAAFLSHFDPVDRAPLAAIARELAAHISRAFFLNDTEIYLTVSIGIALSEAPADNTIDLIRCADIAMYHAKQSGGGTHTFYAPEMSTAVVERLVLQNKLRRSIELNELVTLYQPLVNLRTGRVVGAEALLRWRLPGHGDIPPSEFIPLAEQSGLIHAIGEWVFRQVSSDYASWRSTGLTPERLSINLSLRQFWRSGTVERIAAVLREYHVSPVVIELEITESTLMDTERSRPALDALTALGFRLAIDDFGTGYSSLAALRQMPVQTLKIDQSFVRRALESEGDAMLVRTIIEMGRNLGLEVVGEGVETLEQHHLLARLGCHLGQGTLYGAPMGAGEFQARLRSGATDSGIERVRA